MQIRFLKDIKKLSNKINLYGAEQEIKSSLSELQNMQKLLGENGEQLEVAMDVLEAAYNRGCELEAKIERLETIQVAYYAAIERETGESGTIPSDSRKAESIQILQPLRATF